MKLVAALALLTVCAFADGDAVRADTALPAAEPSAALGATLQAELERRVAAIERSGIVVGSIDGDNVTVFKAGTSGTGRPLDEDTLFEIGSVTKTFTATLLATMVLDGSVKLEDPVANYMPAGVTVPARNGKQITLRDLATQRSGLPRLPDNMNAEAVENVNDSDFINRHGIQRDRVVNRPISASSRRTGRSSARPSLLRARPKDSSLGGRTLRTRTARPSERAAKTL